MKLSVQFAGVLLPALNYSVAAAAQTDSRAIGALIEPEPVRFSFAAPGWYVLAILILSVTFVLVFRWLQNYRRNAYRREALQKLSSIANLLNAESPQSCLNQTLVLLKLVAMKTYGRPQVASLQGREWLDFLEAKGRATPFSRFADSVDTALHAGGDIEGTEVEAVMHLSKTWIKTHAG